MYIIVQTIWSNKCNFEKDFLLERKNKIPSVDSADYSFI